MKRLGLSLFIAVVVVLAGVSAGAAGPADGIWQVSNGTLTFFASVHEDDASLPSGFNVVIILLDFTSGLWQYSLGVESGSSIQGNSFKLDGTPQGTFTLTLTSATTFTGQGIDKHGVVSPLTGVKIF